MCPEGWTLGAPSLFGSLIGPVICGLWLTFPQKSENLGYMAITKNFKDHREEWPVGLRISLASLAQLLLSQAPAGAWKV